MRSLLLIIFLFAFTTLVKAQSYIYQYVDPCTKNIKFVSVPLSGANVAVTYYGQVGTFSNADFSNGNFISWLNQTSGSNAGKPCDQATTQAVNSTNLIVTNNIISTLTNITSVSMMAASLSSNVAGTVGGNLGNTVSNGSSGDGSGNGSGDGKKDDKKNSSGNGNSGSGNNNNSNGSSGSNGNNQSSGSTGSTNNQGNGSSNNNGGNTTGSSGNTGSGNTGSGSGSGQAGGNPASGSGGSGSGSGGSTQGGGSTSQPPVGNTGSTGSTGTGGNGNTNGGGTGSAGGTGNTTETGGATQSSSSSGSGGTANSVSNAAEGTSSGGGSSSGGSSKNGDKNRARTGALIGTGDIVAVRSAEEGEKDQFKFTMSMTKSNTKNTFARGFLGNFTTQINNSNVTFYGAWTLPKSKTTIIAANSSMINPDRDFFNTTTLLASKRFTKLSLMGGLNFTAGAIGETGFQNLSAVGGGFYMFNAGKKITATLLVLGVYSPFTQFYEGNWWSSGLLVVPFSSWDYSITKKFKFNISFSGTYEMNKNMLNYQVLTGGKVML
jgi:hypothetical protein